MLWLLCPVLLANASADTPLGHAKLEWGIGLVSLGSPDYLGSAERQNQLLPFPYIKYRGDFLYIDEGIEGRLFKSPDLLLGISGNGSLPSPDDNPVRDGMPELDATFELGPSLEYRWWHDTSSEIWLEFPLRFAFRINSELDSIGRTINPRLSWRKPSRGKYDWKLEFSNGLVFADDKFHGYFYNVTQDIVTDDRPFFDADSGYSGFRSNFTYSRRFGKAWLGGFLRYDDLQQSEIEGSPLVQEQANLTAGIAIAWIFSEN
jgi:outer membrane scaffolding protein for murein synthesis (MipA/OmpV family)